MQDTWVRSLCWEDPLEKEMATHSSILAWRIPRTVWSMGSQRVRHDWVTFTFGCLGFILSLLSVCKDDQSRFRKMVHLGGNNGISTNDSDTKSVFSHHCCWGVARRSISARVSDFTFTFHFHELEKEMATHSSVLAWRIPGGLPSMGSHRVRHDWSDLAAAATILNGRNYTYVKIVHRPQSEWHIKYLFGKFVLFKSSI